MTKPFPPDRYPLVIVGSGPGALQTSYFLKWHRIRHAVLSADVGAAGMFRQFPFFERLISWSKPYPPTDAGALSYERFDWNSLLAENPRHRGLVRKAMDKTSYFPRRSEMQQGLERFSELTGLKVRYGCRWEETRREGEHFILSTTAGEYSAPILVFAVGVTQPWTPPLPGAQHTTHYVDQKPPRKYAGKRVFIIGKRNSAFETAHGLLPWSSRIIMASPRPVHFSIYERHPSAARAIYMQPYEDFVLGGGHYVLDAVLAGIERTAGAFRVHLDGTTAAVKWRFEVDEIIAATGFQTPLRDLPQLGVQSFGHQRFPALTPYWASATVPGIYFAGSASQGAPGLIKYGRASSSGVVHGFRHNARVLADHLARNHFGRPRDGLGINRRALPSHLLDAAAEDGALWNQQAYLARVVEFDGEAGAQDVGLEPLAYFVDASEPDAIAMTIETDNEGDIHPAVYLRRNGNVTEHRLEAGPLLEFRTKENRRLLKSLLESVWNTAE